jgi:hypothetical protein
MTFRLPQLDPALPSDSLPLVYLHLYPLDCWLAWLGLAWLPFTSFPLSLSLSGLLSPISLLKKNKNKNKNKNKKVKNIRYYCAQLLLVCENNRLSFFSSQWTAAAIILIEWRGINQMELPIKIYFTFTFTPLVWQLRIGFESAQYILTKIIKYLPFYYFCRPDQCSLQRDNHCRLLVFFIRQKLAFIILLPSSDGGSSLRSFPSSSSSCSSLFCISCYSAFLLVLSLIARKS